ncbi:hypothetical protein Riv7116_2208 [Rivularia sp. PCC 7116]|nr:hypothetical protein Riv7116_2208 [Rivularia sp. PCC 7116]
MDNLAYPGIREGELNFEEFKRQERQHINNLKSVLKSLKKKINGT